MLGSREDRWWRDGKAAGDSYCLEETERHTEEGNRGDGVQYLSVFISRNKNRNFHKVLIILIQLFSVLFSFGFIFVKHIKLTRKYI